jgi:Spy/CpxP family protein refolding chaperone
MEVAMHTKRMTAFMVTILMGIVTISIAQARPFTPQEKAGDIRPDFHRLRPFLQMDLTDTQRSQINDIVLRYRDEHAKLRADIQMKRKDFADLLQSESFDEEKARKVFQKDSIIKEKEFILRTKMLMEIKAVLTSDQLDLLREHKVKRMERTIRHFRKAVEH